MENEKVRCIEDGSKAWIICPVCHRGKLLKVNADVTARCLPMYCRFCKQESVIDIAKNPRFPGGVSVTLSSLQSSPIASKNPVKIAAV